MNWYMILASFVGTIAFSVLYNIPPQNWLGCGLVGVTGWIVFSLVEGHVGYGIAIFIASSVVTFLARLQAVRKKTPEIVYLIAGIFTLVPGADIYWTVYYIVSEQFDKAASSGSDAMTACLGMVLGIVMIHEIPQRAFVSLAGGKKRNEGKK